MYTELSGVDAEGSSSGLEEAMPSALCSNDDNTAVLT
jgi:hypothetical protein